MSHEKQADELIDKSKALSISILELIDSRIKHESKHLNMKIALLALTKVSATFLYSAANNEDDFEKLFDLFIRTILGSAVELENMENAKDVADKMINKLKGMQ